MRSDNVSERRKFQHGETVNARMYSGDVQTGVVVNSRGAWWWRWYLIEYIDSRYPSLSRREGEWRHRSNVWAVKHPDKPKKTEYVTDTDVPLTSEDLDRVWELGLAAFRKGRP